MIYVQKKEIYVMHFKKLLILSAVTFLSFTISAQEKAVYTLTADEAVILATDNNVNLKRQKLNLDLLKKKNATSWNSVSPSVSGTGTYSHSFLETKPANPVTDTLSGTVSVSMALSPALFTSIKTAALNYENGKSSYEDAVRSIELNVRKLYYSLIFAKENISLQERNLETAKQRYELNLDKYNKGQLSELDMLSSMYSYDSAKPSLESSIITYENNIATFKQTLGLKQDEEIILTGSLDDFSKLGEISVDVIIEEIPSVKTLKRNLEIAKANLMATRFTAWGPSVSLGYNYGYSSALANDEWSDFSNSTNSLSVNVRIPLDGYLPWSTGSVNIAAMKTSVKDLELQLENEKTTAELNIQNIVKKIKQAESQLTALEQNVQLAQKTYDMTLNAYNHGSRDLLTLQSTADALLSAKTSLQSQLYTLASAILDLENTLGIPFGTLGKTEN